MLQTTGESTLIAIINFFKKRVTSYDANLDIDFKLNALQSSKVDSLMDSSSIFPIKNCKIIIHIKWI